MGSALGYILGGVVGEAYGWRAAFFIAGAPGAVLAFLLLLTEPSRGAFDPEGAAPVSLGLGDSLRALAARRSYVCSLPTPAHRRRMARGQRAIAPPALAFAPTRRPVPGPAPGSAGQTQAGRTPAAPAEVAAVAVIVPIRSRRARAENQESNAEGPEMMKRHSISVAIGLLLASFLLGCQHAGNKVGVDEKEIQGFKTKTFFNNSENVEVTIASDGKSTIVAVPKTAISRRNEMGDDEYKCLKACKDIDDLERRLNCILLCPVTKQYQIFIF